MPTAWRRSRQRCVTPAARSCARCFPSPGAAASSSSSPVATNWRCGPNATRPERRPTRSIEVAHALRAWRRVRRQRFQGLAEPGRRWPQRGLRRPHRCWGARPVPGRAFRHRGGARSARLDARHHHPPAALDRGALVRAGGR
ncbi:hypothetical protein G6F59_016340 [Rhizopus arrhizus]|nr:hypothetical protein G6F59_016340 [Rhizopus arrhizus]